MKGYRTLIANTLASLVPILEMTEVMQVLPDGWEPWYVIGLAVINMGLRWITTTPMGQAK